MTPTPLLTRDPAARRGRATALAPMIDLVFLLIVFFLLAARFDSEARLDLAASGAGEDAAHGPPRLIDVRPDGIALNGLPIAADELVARLMPLLPDPAAPVLLRPGPGATVADLVGVIARLQTAGIEGVAIVEPLR